MRRTLRSHRLPDGRTIRFDLRRQGGESHPVVVFLNGLSQTSVAWSLHVEALRGVRDTLVYDAAGQGRSDPSPEGFRPEDHARDLLHLLDAAGLRRVDLVGFSFGSRIALRLVLARPGQVRRLVLVGCAHRETVLRRWMVASWLAALEQGGPEHCFEVVTPAVMGEAWLARNEHLRGAMVRAFVQRNDPESMRRLLMDTLIEGGSLGDELRGVAHPALVLRGAEDIVVPRSLNDELVGLLPAAAYAECAGSGHTVMVEDPEWFTDRLREFLVLADA